ncbi:hypothetical protein [Streptomyces gilvosporeus]|uniref:Transcriptional regulator n=1 Tax=Streptomyces gilvosporeus TaxID=553510 RepID=A0A1V0TLT4_9ACTN|nr:hypothetical protein [Streptomyces gilvosporeus]ARF53896.1 hypothetical protein B1H19_06615 [Streptomyces gilvosporeus]
MPSSRRRNENLRALLTEAQWTQAALARSVNALAAEIGLDLHYDRTGVAHWLSGTQPAPPVPDLIAESLTRRLGRAVSPGVAGLLSPPCAPPSGRPAEGGSPAETALTDVCALESDPARRTAARLAPYREAELAKLVADQHERSPRLPVSHDGADDGELAVVRFAVRFYAASFNAHGGGSARSALAAYLADDIAPRLREPDGAAGHRGLLVEASRLTFLLARMYQDASVHGLAQRHFTTALRLAEESGDPTAPAVVLRGLSAQGLALGHRRMALDAAEAAVAAARAPGAATRAFLASQLAVAQAACGVRRAAVASLGVAERALEAQERGAGPGGPFAAYSRASLAFQSAEVLRHTGDPTAARTELHRSLVRRSDDDHRGLALSYARHAEILVGLGHVEEACASWNSFLDHYVHLRSGSADLAAVRLRKSLIPFRRVPAAAALLHRTGAMTPSAQRG